MSDRPWFVSAARFTTYLLRKQALVRARASHSSEGSSTSTKKNEWYAGRSESAWFLHRLRHAPETVRHSSDGPARLLKHAAILADAFKRVRAHAGRLQPKCVRTEDEYGMTIERWIYGVTSSGDEIPCPLHRAIKEKKMPLFAWNFNYHLLLFPSTVHPIGTTCTFTRVTKKGDRTLHRSRLEVCPAAASSISALHKPIEQSRFCTLFTGSAFANLRPRLLRTHTSLSPLWCHRSEPCLLSVQ